MARAKRHRWMYQHDGRMGWCRDCPVRFESRAGRRRGRVVAYFRDSARLPDEPTPPCTPARKKP